MASNGKPGVGPKLLKSEVRSRKRGRAKKEEFTMPIPTLPPAPVPRHGYTLSEPAKFAQKLRRAQRLSKYQDLLAMFEKRIYAVIEKCPGMTRKQLLEFSTTIITDGELRALERTFRRDVMDFVLTQLRQKNGIYFDRAIRGYKITGIAYDR